MLLLLHSLTRKRRTMPRQARKLSGTGIRHVILCRHSPACKTDRCLFRRNTIIVANEMITRTVPMIHKRDTAHDEQHRTDVLRDFETFLFHGLRSSYIMVAPPAAPSSALMMYPRICRMVLTALFINLVF